MASRALSRLLADQYFYAMVASRRRGPIYSVTDLGELAVRLGSIVRFDRRGDVVFLDSFEEGLLKWEESNSGAGAAVELSNEEARSGGWSVKLTAGSDMNHYAGIKHYLPYPVLSRMGMECSWSFDSDLAEMWMLFQLYSGATRSDAIVRYDYANRKLQYQDASQAWVDLAVGLDLYLGSFIFWTWKLVADFEKGEKGEYVRVIMNETEYNLEGVPLFSEADGHIAMIVPGIRNVTGAGKNGVVFADDVIIYQNEPENQR